MAALVAATLVLAGGCAQEPLGPEAERGRQVYQAQCIACHNPDPAQAGAVGPPVKGSSEDLLRAKIVNGSYPSGYTPKRPTALMQPMPQLASEISNFAAYLR
ncbi:MAG: cytochrome c [Candidatus Rokubacteria bacterium]|nr:cytochrome c [Candidatus Rokubacteria bacterium]